MFQRSIVTAFATTALCLAVATPAFATPTFANIRYIYSSPPPYSFITYNLSSPQDLARTPATSNVRSFLGGCGVTYNAPVRISTTASGYVVDYRAVCAFIHGNAASGQLLFSGKVKNVVVLPDDVIRSSVLAQMTLFFGQAKFPVAPDKIDFVRN